MNVYGDQRYKINHLWCSSEMWNLVLQSSRLGSLSKWEKFAMRFKWHRFKLIWRTIYISTELKIGKIKFAISLKMIQWGFVSKEKSVFSAAWILLSVLPVIFKELAKVLFVRLTVCLSVLLSSLSCATKEIGIVRTSNFSTNILLSGRHFYPPTLSLFQTHVQTSYISNRYLGR